MNLVKLYQAHKVEKQKIHADWYKQNTAILIESGLRFEIRSEAYLFREDNKPKVDFYPSTGRWQSNGKMYRGGAGSFINWYSKQ